MEVKGSSPFGSIMDKIIRVKITAAELKYAESIAEKFPFVGVSYVRDDREDRVREASSDQITGQLGNIIGTKFLFGGYFMYRLSRWIADIDPYRGDGGSDVPGAGIDFKTSLMRYGKNPNTYHLCVRPAERHKNTTYIHILLDMDNMEAFITGWATDEMLPDKVLDSGPLSGAYVIPVPELNQIMPMNWFAA